MCKSLAYRAAIHFPRDDHFRKNEKYTKSAIVLTMSVYQKAEVDLYTATSCKENMKFVGFFSPTNPQFFYILKYLCSYMLLYTTQFCSAIQVTLWINVLLALCNYAAYKELERSRTK